jgi:hypothetical protein
MMEIIIYRQRERANMHCQGIACTRSFGMGLTTAEGKKRCLSHDMIPNTERIKTQNYRKITIRNSTITVLLK